MKLDQAAVGRVERMVDRMETSTGIKWRRKDDMISEGLLGLIEAGRRYDKEGGAGEWTFAYRRVRGRIIDAMRKMIRDQRRYAIPDSGDKRTGRAEADTRRPDLSRQMPQATNSFSLNGRSIESTLTAREVSLVIARALSMLSHRKKRLVVECAMRRRPLIHVAGEMDLGRGRARRILDQAMLEMRWYLTQEGYSLEDFT